MNAAAGIRYQETAVGRLPVGPAADAALAAALATAIAIAIAVRRRSS